MNHQWESNQVRIPYNTITEKTNEERTKLIELLKKEHKKVIYSMEKEHNYNYKSCEVCQYLKEIEE